MTVEEFVAREAAQDPYPGACCVVVDRWVRHRHGFSMLARYGREIKTDDDVQRWLSEPGGIAVAVNRVMRCCGFTKIKVPQAGDVGLIIHGEPVEGHIPLSMGIIGQQGWYSRNSRGLLMVPHDAVWKAWAI